MKKALFPLSLVLSVLVSKAQSPDHAWTKQIGGTLNETATFVNVDTQGNVYTVGYFEGTTDFDPSPATTYTMASPGTISMFIQKLDAQGNFLWARQYMQMAQINGSFMRPQAQSFFLNGDICVSGYFQGLFDFDPGPGNNILYAQVEGAFVLRMDAQGNYVWAKSFGGTTSTMLNSMKVDASDNIYTTGFYVDTTDFDPSLASTFYLPGNAANSAEAFVSKISGSGNFVWAKKLATNTVSIANDINVDAMGGVYVTGTFEGTADFDPGAGTQNHTANDQDIFVWKLDASGNYVWSKTMGGSARESGLVILNDANQNCYIGGFFNGTTDLDPGAGTASFTSGGDDDMYMLKLDASGNFLWARAMGSTGTDVITSMAMDASGGIYSTGQFAGTVDFNAGAGINTLATSTRGNPFILKYDNNGNFKWVKQISCTDYAGGSSITLDASKNVYSVGIFSVTADFDPNAGVYNLTSLGDVDAYVHKLVCTEAPVVSASSSQTLLCEGNTATLTPTGATSYSWNTVAGTTHVVSPTVTTTYTLMGKDANGCTAEAYIEQLVSKCTGLKELRDAAAVNVYPNPNNGAFTIETAKPLNIKIVNMLGKVVYTSTISGTEQVTLEQFPSGIYFLQTPEAVIKIVKN